VVRDYSDKGAYKGVAAVIDKDMAGELLAEDCKADMLVLLTAVDHVAINFGKPDQEDLTDITAEQAREYAEENGLSDQTPSRSIAYLFIPFENGAAATKKVESAYAALKSAPVAATLQAQDVGTYGTEENITPENGGIQNITEWLFDAQRRIGDYARLDTAGATYLVLYTENGASFAEVEARRALFDSAFAAWYNEWVEKLTFGYNYDCLDSYDVS
jgi:hypothetical protein